jgi:hypothetical protein
MRFVRVLLALVFGLAMAGPEMHACPLHSATPAGHHQDASSHQDTGESSDALCTCPQACCPTAVNVSLPTPPAGWIAAARPVLTVGLESIQALVLPSRTHFLPFALAPPHTPA